MIDMSASGLFGTAMLSKRELAAELAAMVAFSAIKNNDRVGLFLVTDKVERYVPPKKGKRHVMRVVGEILSFQPTSRGTDLAVGLEPAGQRLAAAVVLDEHVRSVVAGDARGAPRDVGAISRRRGAGPRRSG